MVGTDTIQVLMVLSKQLLIGDLEKILRAKSLIVHKISRKKIKI